MLGRNLLHQPLMGRIAERVEQAHGQGFDTGLDQLVYHRPDFGRIERDQHRAAVVEAFGDLTAQKAWHERLGIFQRDIVDVVAALAADFERVPKASGRDQTRLGALALNNRVGDQCRAVDQLRDVLGADGRLTE